MLKHILAVSAASAALVFVSAAQAATPDVTVTITGSVTPKCAAASATQNVNLTDLDSADGTYAGEALNENIGAIWCNAAASVTITAKPIIGDHTTTDTPFTSRIDYVLTAPSGSVLNGAPSLSTVGTVAGTGATENLPIPQAFDTGASNSTYTLTTQSTGSNKLVAGAYAGEIDVSMMPHL
ncbi:MAG: hypothetical protein WBQ17_03355 [Rhizomicrobium sp.]